MPAPLHERRDIVGSLARLDRRIVPPLQRLARRLAHAAGAPLRSVARAEDRLAPRITRAVVGSWRAVALVAALLVVAAAAVHLDRYPDLREAARPQADEEPPPPVRELPGEAGDPLGVSGDAVGPRRGEDLDAYVQQRDEVRRGLVPSARVVAVVSFEEYRTPEAVAELIGNDLEVHLAQYRIPAEGERPQELPVGDDLAGSIGAAVEDAVAPILEEIHEVERLLASGTVVDRDFEADLERRLSELRAVRNLLDTAPAIVFAVVVEGTAAEVASLAEHADVRLVDPAPTDTDVTAATFYGLLPEDRGEATFGAPR